MDNQINNQMDNQMNNQMDDKMNDKMDNQMDNKMDNKLDNRMDNQMDNRNSIKKILISFLSIVLLLSFISFFFTTDLSFMRDKNNATLMFILVIGIIDISIQIFGILAILGDHYCCSFAFTIYQVVCLFFVIINIITGFISLFAFLIRVIILILCIMYVRELKQNSSNNPKVFTFKCCDDMVIIFLY